MTQENALTEIRNALNIKRTDFFLAYGMPSTSRDIVRELIEKGYADVATGFCLTPKEKEESAALKTKLYLELKDLEADSVYDKVLCFYNALPKAHQDLHTVIDNCLNVCVDDALILLLGIPPQRKTALVSLLAKRGVATYWFLNNRQDIGVIIKKESQPKNGKRNRKG